MRTKPLAASVLALIPLLLESSGAQRAADEPRFVAKSSHARDLEVCAVALERIGFSGAVLVADRGKVEVALGLGAADGTGEQRCTANTLFEIASATKQFTGAAICKLAQDGDLELDDAISIHLPNVPAECAAITVRHLLQHTSGVPGTNSAGGGDDLAAVVPIFLRGGPQREPGTHFEYWNQGYALLAGIVARASGKSFNDYCRKELFAPAKLAHTLFTGDEAPRKAEVAIGRSDNGEPRGALEHPYGGYGYQYLGMGGAVSNVWDLWRWDRALDGKKPLGEAIKRELFAPGLESYALGWFVREEDGVLVQSHGGGVRGFVSELRRYPATDGFVCVLSNDDHFQSWAVAGYLERAMRADKVELPPHPMSSELQSALVGEYEGERGSKLVVTRRGDVVEVLRTWPAGQRTSGYFGWTEAKGTDIVFFDWHRRIDVIAAKQDAAGQCPSIQLGDERFVRL